MTKLKLTQPELGLGTKPKPSQIVTESSDEFQRVFERAERGEFVIESLAVGKTQAQWVFSVRWK